MAFKRKLAWTLTAAVLGLGIYISTNPIPSNADGAALGGSVDDPLVTKSYVDQKLAALASAPTSTPAPTPTPAPTTPTPSASDSSAFSKIEVVVLKAGEILYANSGTEVIVRTGRTVAVSSDENGIPDVTAGKDIASGSPVELNHLLIFPKDSRGIKPAPDNKGDIYVMVRGSYRIQK